MWIDDWRDRLWNVFLPTQGDAFFFEDSHMTNSDMRGISLFSQRVLDYKKNSLCKGLYF